MRTAAQATGDAAEAAVAGRLRAMGWTILGRNIRVGRAEIDLLAVDPGPPAMLVVVEVRMRSRREFGLPEEQVGRAKVARLRGAGLAVRSARRLATGVPVPAIPLRLDLAVLEPGRPVRHHRAIG